MGHDLAGPLLILGGTFDPPHIAHLILAECARVQFAPGQVRFIPAGVQYLKGGVHSDAADRLAMVRHAVAGNEHFAVDDREIRREGPTYTVETLEELRAEGHDELILVLGADAFAGIHQWRSPGRVRELARLAVAPRPGAPARSIAGATPIDMPPIDLSSTAIRERARAGKSIRYLVPDAVAEYIARRGLYADSTAPP